MAKRNLLKIPAKILDQIKTYDQDDVVVASVKLLKAEDFVKYAHLGLFCNSGEIILPVQSIPDPSRGRYSKANVEGYEKKRHDLPMIQKEFSFESPNFGDWSRGSHTVSQIRDVYQRTFYPPKEVELSVTLLKNEGDSFFIKFSIEQVISRRTPNFEKELLYNLNILQENVGSVNVFTSAATLAEYTSTIQVDWQIFPPGTVDSVVQSMLKGKAKVSPDQESVIKERVTVMSKLKPEVYITGSDNFFRYFGAKFGDDFVVFENINYGNALYVMYDSWQVLSQKSRVELLSGPREGFDRIEHRDGWELVLKKMVIEYRAVKKAGG